MIADHIDSFCHPGRNTGKTERLKVCIMIGLGGLSVEIFPIKSPFRAIGMAPANKKSRPFRAAIGSGSSQKILLGPAAWRATVRFALEQSPNHLGPLRIAHLDRAGNQSLPAFGRHRSKPIPNTQAHVLGQLLEPAPQIFRATRVWRTPATIGLGFTPARVATAFHLAHALADLPSIALTHLIHLLGVGL